MFLPLKSSSRSGLLKGDHFSICGGLRVLEALSKPMVVVYLFESLIEHSLEMREARHPLRGTGLFMLCELSSGFQLIRCLELYWLVAAA